MGFAVGHRCFFFLFLWKLLFFYPEDFIGIFHSFTIFTIIFFSYKLGIFILLTCNFLIGMHKYANVSQQFATSCLDTKLFFFFYNPS